MAKKATGKPVYIIRRKSDGMFQCMGGRWSKNLNPPDLLIGKWPTFTEAWKNAVLPGTVQFCSAKYDKRGERLHSVVSITETAVGDLLAAMLHGQEV